MSKIKIEDAQSTQYNHTIDTPEPVLSPHPLQLPLTAMYLYSTSCQLYI